MMTKDRGCICLQATGPLLIGVETVADEKKTGKSFRL